MIFKYKTPEDKTLKGSQPKGKRTSHKTSLIEFKGKDGKWHEVKRRNANQEGKAKGGKKYYESRVDKTDNVKGGKWRGN